MENVYLFAKSYYDQRKNLYSMGLRSEEEDEKNKHTLEMMKVCFNQITKLSDYSNVLFNCCNLVMTYVPENRVNAYELIEKKRSDYGIEPLLITGQIGIVVRVIAKLCRLVNLHGKEINFESIKDNKMDIFNYGLIGIQMINGELK